MDFIIGNYSSLNNNLTLFQAVSNLYMATLDAKDLKLVTVPEGLYDYAVAVYKGLGGDPNLVSVKGELRHHGYSKSDSLRIFLYTGGKDSLASYMKYKSNFNIGIFIEGLNPLYPKEGSLLDYHSKVLGLEIEKVKLKAPRLRNQPESSVKNLLSFVIAIDYFKVIPEYISFGFINPDLEVFEELSDLDEEHYNHLKRESIFDESSEGSLQTSEVAGDSKEVMIQAVGLIEKYYEVKTTAGIASLEKTYKLVKKSGLINYLTSCMSLTTFKEYNKKTSLNKYGLDLEGEKVFGGVVRVRENGKVFKASLESVINKQKPCILYNYTTKSYERVEEVKFDHVKRVCKAGEYNCTTCFKCCEHYIAMYNFLGYKFNRDFILSRYGLLLKNFQKAGNANNVDFSQWIKYDLMVTEDLLDDLVAGRYITKKVREAVLAWLE